MTLEEFQAALVDIERNLEGAGYEVTLVLRDGRYESGAVRWLPDLDLGHPCCVFALESESALNPGAIHCRYIDVEAVMAMEKA